MACIRIQAETAPRPSNGRGGLLLLARPERDRSGRHPCRAHSFRRALPSGDGRYECNSIAIADLVVEVSLKVVPHDNPHLFRRQTELIAKVGEGRARVNRQLQALTDAQGWGASAKSGEKADLDVHAQLPLCTQA